MKRLGRGCLAVIAALIVLVLIGRALPPAAPRSFAPQPTAARAEATPLPPTARSTAVDTPPTAENIDPAVLATQNYFTDLMTQVFVTQQGAVAPTLPPAILPTEPPAAVVYELDDALYFAQGSVNVRACPSTDCEIVGPLLDGESVLVTGQAPGEVIRGINNVWYRVTYAGREGFVYSEFVTNVRATAVPPTRVPPTRVPVQQAPISTRPPAVSPYTCDGQDNLNCSNFCSDLRAAQAHMLMCDDEDDLDGNENGVACEAGC